MVVQMEDPRNVRINQISLRIQLIARFVCYEPKALWSMVEEVAKLIVPGFNM